MRPMENYLIKAPTPHVNGKHWELIFSDSIARTDDAALAKRYGDRGYEVLKTEPEKDQPEPEKTPETGSVQEGEKEPEKVQDPKEGPEAEKTPETGEKPRARRTGESK